MAYLQSDDEEQKKVADPLAQQQTGGGNSLPTTGGGAVGAPAAAQPNQQGFGNIMNYLDANKDQALGVAGTIAQNLGDQYGQAKSTIDTAAMNAMGDVNKNTVNYDPNMVSSAVSNPAEFVKNPTNLSSFTAQRDATYKGPGSFEDTSYYGDAAKAAAKASDTYNAGKSASGFSGLLNQVSKNPTAGRNALDVGLLQTDPASAAKINAALDPFKDISGYLAGKSSEINKGAESAKKATTEAAQKTKLASADAQASFERDLQSRFAAANQNYNDFLAGQNSTLSNPDYQRYASLLNSLYGVSVPTSPTAPTSIPELANVASQQDFARAAALTQLSGQPDAILSPADIGKAGGWQEQKSTLPSANDLRSQMQGLDNRVLSFAFGSPDGLKEQIALYPNLFYDALNAGNPGLRQEYAKAAARQGHLDKAQLTNPDLMWQAPDPETATEIRNLKTVTSPLSSVDTFTPPAPPPTPPASYDPNDQSTWTQEFHPADWNYDPLYNDPELGDPTVTSPWSKITLSGYKSPDEDPLTQFMKSAYGVQ